MPKPAAVNPGDVIASAHINNMANYTEEVEGTVSTLGSSVSAFGDSISALQINADLQLPMSRSTVFAEEDLTWVNQGTSTLDHFGSYFKMVAPASAVDSLRILHTTPPTAPWTFDAIILPDGASTNWCSFGIGVYDTSSTQITALGISFNNGWIIDVTRFNNPTSWNATTANVINIGMRPYIYLRIINNSTNFLFKYSANGIVYHQLYSQTLTAWGTPTKIAAFVNSHNSFEAGMAVFTMKCEENPA